MTVCKNSLPAQKVDYAEAEEVNADETGNFYKDARKARLGCGLFHNW